MKAWQIRFQAFVVFVLSVSAVFFQNCSQNIAFKSSLPEQSIPSYDGGLFSSDYLTCEGGALAGDIKWKEVVGDSFNVQQECPFGGDFSSSYKKLQKYVCIQGKFVPALEFRPGDFIKNIGGCDCEGGLHQGEVVWKDVAGQITSIESCQASGSVKLIYGKQQKISCQNGQLIALDEFQKGAKLGQEGSCSCSDGTAEGSSIFKTVSGATILEAVTCPYGGNLQNVFEKKQQFICTSSFLVPQNNFQKGALIGTQGSCYSQVIQESFSVATISAIYPLDMIWVIDNSGSMSTEASHVRANLKSFISTVNNSADLKFLLVSKVGTTGTSVSLPVGLDANKFNQIDIAVGSTDGASKLISSLSGLASPFFRGNSKKAIVFVTDDESSMTALTFLANLKILGVQQDQVSIFGFIGIGASLSPCQAREGMVYKALSAATNGKYYNICDSNWDSHFTDLSVNVLSKLGRTFKLGDALAKVIIKVEVDGLLLDGAKYSYAAGVLTLAESVVLTSSSVVKVYYSK